MARRASDLTKGSFIIVDRDPYVVLSLSHSHIGRGGAVFQTRIRNLRTGTILERNFKPGETLTEAAIVKIQAQFIYERRGEYWFYQKGMPANRFPLAATALKDKNTFLKPNMEVTALKFSKEDKEEVINIELPVKADYKVIQAPPSIRGNTADGGRKIAIIESGAKVNVPLFIEEGDTIRVNTETGEYAERVYPHTN